MVLPLLDSMAISPWSLTSATVPPGLPLPQFHETEMALSVMIFFGIFFFLFFFFSPQILWVVFWELLTTGGDVHREAGAFVCIRVWHWWWRRHSQTCEG
jgi:hypothetical protein